MIKKIVKILMVAMLSLAAAGYIQTNTAQAVTKTKSELLQEVSNRTTDIVKNVFYADYDGDGKKEMFIITKNISEEHSIWFASNKETKKLVKTYYLYTGKSTGICKADKKQKLFIAEGDAGGSGSWSYCYYVSKGHVYKVKKSGEGLCHISGRDFAVHPSAFDANYYDGIGTGHTWKRYYLKWTGIKFEQYVGKKISQTQLKKYSGGGSYLKKIKKVGYKIGTIYYRKNGIININVSQRSNEGGTDYSNITLKVKGKKVQLVTIYPKGKDIVEKSSYGGIYKAKCNL